MAKLNVSPTRMELTRLKRELQTAKRGHKLLKDKQDEMVRRFMDMIKNNRKLRLEIEEELKEVSKSFKNARLKMSNSGLLEALMVPSQSIEINTSSTSVMNMTIPKLDIVTKEDIDLTYGFAFTVSDLDSSVLKLSKLVSKMVKLAEIEKSCDMLAVEIEKTRRRVNAIEYVMIPNYEETIHYIVMKLEDNERSSTIRLMKSKEIILKRQNVN